MPPMDQQLDLLKGTLDLLIMRMVAHEPMHGWAIAQRIQLVSKEVLQVQQGSLYPALHRLEHQGWIRSEWGESEHNRRAKYYSLTQAGKKKLGSEIEQWDRLSAAISLVKKFPFAIAATFWKSSRRKSTTWTFRRNSWFQSQRD